MNLFIGCGSSNKISDKYLLDCEQYLNELLKDNNVIFGASALGLMGKSYSIAKQMGNKVVGICPEVYKNDLLEIDCDEEILTKSISERTERLIELSDAIVFLPGGIGTIYEFFTCVELKRNHEFDKPIVVYNSNHFYDQLFVLLEKIYNEEYTSRDVQDCYFVAENASETLLYIKGYLEGKS